MMETNQAEGAIEMFSSYLSSHHFDSLNLAIENESFIGNLAEDILNVVPAICSTFDEAKGNLAFIESLRKVLIALAERANPKETTIVLLEQVDRFRNKSCFVSLLKPLIIVLKKLPRKQNNFLKWIVETLYACVETFPLPSDNLESSDDDVVDDAKKLALEEVTFEFIHFLDQFIREVFNRHEFETEDVGEQKRLLWGALMDVIRFPLVHFRIPCDADGDDEMFRCVNSVINLLAIFKPNLLTHFEDFDNRRSEALADAGLAYLLMCFHPVCGWQPSVYSHTYKLSLFVRHIVTLLQNKNGEVVRKGLSSCDALLSVIAESSLASDMLSLPGFSKLPEKFVEVMLGNPDHHSRQRSLKLLHVYFNKFRDKGRYDLILRTMNRFSHSGVRGIVILKYKDYLNHSLNNECPSTYYRGPHLTNMLQAMLKINDADDIDLLEYSDQIISSLNFLRFIIIKDSDNLTGIFDSCNADLYGAFINDIKRSAKMCRTHYLLEVEIAERASEQESIVDLEDGIRTEVEKPCDRVNMLRSALNTLDLIRSLVARFEELVSQNSGEKVP